MGGRVNFRKRSRSVTENSVPVKKLKIGAMVDTSDKSADKRFGYVEQDTEISFKMPTQIAADKIQKENVPPQPKSPIASEKTAVLSAMQQNNVSPAVSAVSAASTSPSKEEVDDRETNRRSPNGFLLPDPLPKGELLIDSAKQEWVLGKPIGLGGFGELYLAALKTNGLLSPENYVIKIEPHSNGPLFVEVHFYIRATKHETIKEFKAKQKIKHLGVPGYIGSGTHRRKGKKFRFLVMERFGSDLQRILDHSEGSRFTDKTVCEVGMQVIDSLQYIHKQGYVHKDVKAANLLVGLGVENQHKVHLVDFGLCSRFQTGNIHKQYIHDERWAHEGTLEYTSRDSHIGCTSRRGDIEVLVYNLIEWWGGSLPWDRDIANAISVKNAKFRAFTNPHKFLRHCFRRTGCTYPPLLNKMMNYINNLRFEDEPDYTFLKGLFRQEMRTRGCVPDGRLEFRLGVSSPPIETEAENLEYLKPLEADKRVSVVFDRLCVDAKTWEASREQMISRRDEESLRNPTPAMVDLQNAIRERARQKAIANRSPHHKKQRKSFRLSESEKSEHTPAMLEVMRCMQLKRLNLSVENVSDDVDMVEVGVPAIDLAPSPLQSPTANRKTVAFEKKINLRQRTKAITCDEGIDIVAKLCEIEGNNDDINPQKASLLPQDLLRVSPIPTEVLFGGSRKSSGESSHYSGSDGESVTKNSLNVAKSAENLQMSPDERRRRRELSRLDIFLPPTTGMGVRTRSADVVDMGVRTRSADVVDNGAAMRNLRSAFKFGVTKLFRQVSDSFTSMF